MSKRASSLYQSGSRRSWLKTKNPNFVRACRLHEHRRPSNSAGGERPIKTTAGQCDILVNCRLNRIAAGDFSQKVVVADVSYVARLAKVGSKQLAIGAVFSRRNFRAGERGVDLSIQVAKHLVALSCGVGDAHEALRALDIRNRNHFVLVSLPSRRDRCRNARFTKSLKRDVFRFVRILRWRSSWRILGV
jgi:hypothetical protein